jgi:hypothetical protein
MDGTFVDLTLGVDSEHTSLYRAANEQTGLSLMTGSEVAFPPSVGVFGANGHTGAFVVAELMQRGFTPIAIARDAARLEARGFHRQGVTTRVASVDDPGSLDRAFAGVSAIVNCAGPFLDTAAEVCAAALRAGVHYLDVTAEQASASATLDVFDAAARQAGVTIVPAMGFYGGLADLLCSTATSGWDRVHEVRIGIALDSWWPTHGTRATGQRNTAPRLVIEGGTLVPLGDPAPRTTLQFATPFGSQTVTEVPFTEIPLIARHLRVARLHTWLADTALHDLRDPSTPPPVAADESGRSAQQFLVDVLAIGPDGTRLATARGRDIYAVTAPLVVEAAQRLIRHAGHEPGAFAPGAIFDAADFLGSFPPTVLAVEFTDL